MTVIETLRQHPVSIPLTFLLIIGLCIDGYFLKTKRDDKLAIKFHDSLLILALVICFALTAEVFSQ